MKRKSLFGIWFEINVLIFKKSSIQKKLVLVQNGDQVLTFSSTLHLTVAGSHLGARVEVDQLAISSSPMGLAHRLQRSPLILIFQVVFVVVVPIEFAGRTRFQSLSHIYLYFSMPISIEMYACESFP